MYLSMAGCRKQNGNSRFDLELPIVGVQRSIAGKGGADHMCARLADLAFYGRVHPAEEGGDVLQFDLSMYDHGRLVRQCPLLDLIHHTLLLPSVRDELASDKCQRSRAEGRDVPERERFRGSKLGATSGRTTVASRDERSSRRPWAVPP